MQIGSNSMGFFFMLAGKTPVPIRNRTDVVSSNLRKPDYLPPVEIRQALTAIVGAHLGMTSGEAATEVARLFGFKSTSAQLRQVIEDEIRFLVEETAFEQRNGKLYLAEESMVSGE